MKEKNMRVNSISVERNFHIKEDDRFLMEKISVTVECSDGNIPDTQEAMNKAREMIEQNFKVAYPHLKTYLNFDEVKQVNDSWLSNNIKEKEAEFNKDAIEVIMKGSPLSEPTLASSSSNKTIEIKQPQPKYNLFKEISNCKTLTMLKVLKKMAITDEEIKACDDKMSELTIGSKQEPTY